MLKAAVIFSFSILFFWQTLARGVENSKSERKLSGINKKTAELFNELPIEIKSIILECTGELSCRLVCLEFKDAFCQTVELDLSYRVDRREIYDEGAKVLARVLKSSGLVETINLAGNGIGYEGAMALAEALKVNTKIRELNLWVNNIGDIGATALAKALETNETIKKLNLWNNNISAKGAIALVEALVKNSSLAELDLRANWLISEDVKRRLRNMVAEKAIIIKL